MRRVIMVDRTTGAAITAAPFVLAAVVGIVDGYFNGVQAGVWTGEVTVLIEAVLYLIGSTVGAIPQFRVFENE